MIKNTYKFYEDTIISNSDRFNLSLLEKSEIQKDLINANILILGASGSIGSIFSKRLLEFKFKNLYLADKNENELTELNREIILTTTKNKLKKINYICTDLTILNLDNIIKNKKITHYLNFSAIKHVRSEEELISLKYMFATNSKYFLPNKKHKLKKVFSISTDKTVNPSSLLGISKTIMEKKLTKFKKKNKNVFVSSVRFANVSFSNGSILKYVADRINNKQIFGVPKTIRRYFITHQEASSLCFKSLLKKNDSKILTPNDNYLKKDFLIKDLVKKILILNKYKPKFLSKVNQKIKINKNYPVLLTKPNTHGQKYFEKFHEKSEKVYDDKDDATVSVVNLPEEKNIDQILNYILRLESINKIKIFLMKKFKSYKPPSNIVKVSQNL